MRPKFDERKKYKRRRREKRTNINGHFFSSENDKKILKTDWDNPLTQKSTNSYFKSYKLPIMK